MCYALTLIYINLVVLVGEMMKIQIENMDIHDITELVERNTNLNFEVHFERSGVAYLIIDEVKRV